MITPDITRIEKARAERRLQLIKWDEYDRAYQSTEDTKHRSKQSKTVAFGADLIFLEAAARGDIKEVTQLIKSGINPDVANEDGLTALHQCCIDNNLEMCALLLENGANVNAMDNEDWTPLHAAATCGNKELCGMLINWNADLLALNVDGNMPYDLCDDNDTLILLETEMAKRHVTQEQIDEIRLQPERDMLADLNRRLAAGDDLQALDSQGAAPIHIACSCGFVDVARFLLQHRFDPNLPDQDGWLPIHIAVSWGYLEIVQLLVSYGADMEATTRSGQTVYTICDSREFKVKLQEVWDKREELRNAIKQSNPNQTTIRSRGPSLRKNNTSILRTSMRDKRRLTHAEAVSEKLLGEKIASEEGENGVERLPRPPPKPPVTAGQPVPPPMRQILPIIPKTKPHDIPSPETGAAKTPITRIHVPPSVPPRAVRDLRANGSGVRLNSPELNNNTNTSTTTSGDTPSPAKSPSESSASPSSYVRPMQRNSNGHMVPVVDVLPKCPSERPPPPTRDHRSRTPKRPYSSQASYAAPPNPLLRQGPLPVTSPAEEHRPPRPGSPFLSTDTLNYGSQRRPFSCCHTM